MIGENEFLLRLGDSFFMVFHTVLIFFNLFGWLYKAFLKWHLIVIALTFASWGVLGLWYGFGYCPLTDWHFDILKKLGETDLPPSYISYLLQRLFNLHIPGDVVNGLTLSFSLLALSISLYLNFFKTKKTADL
ncbi:DUF2784 domain-containing protein [Psychroflexus sediminis]|uniref:DUF2784 domain-containing protein n=1 Tax=Psychroflexus sediminis TaxID=470826 RepID=A0A1G7VG82_9FLAO|nr:DUF2784 domain-containing protein [Psychroflexus sediminis]SDG58578.1 Protein of Unknown function [Psychroflexus sediminis]